MICTPSLAHERGINTFTIAPIVVRMKFVASPNVHENAPTTACPTVPNPLPTRWPIPRKSANPSVDPPPCCPAAYAGAATSSSRPAASRLERRTIAIAWNIRKRRRSRGSGEDGRDQNEDHDDPAGDTEQLLRGADVPEHHHPREQHQHQTDAGRNQPRPIVGERADQRPELRGVRRWRTVHTGRPERSKLEGHRDRQTDDRDQSSRTGEARDHKATPLFVLTLHYARSIPHNAGLHIVTRVTRVS